MDVAVSHSLSSVQGLSVGIFVGSVVGATLVGIQVGLFDGVSDGAEVGAVVTIHVVSSEGSDTKPSKHSHTQVSASPMIERVVKVSQIFLKRSESQDFFVGK
jgi:hypothetical protein